MTIGPAPMIRMDVDVGAFGHVLASGVQPGASAHARIKSTLEMLNLNAGSALRPMAAGLFHARRHQLHEALEQVDGCRSGRGSLRGGTAPRRPACPSQARPSLVPSNRLTWVTSTPSGSVFVVHREAVVLAGDLDLAGGEVLHRLVGAAMAAVQLVGARAERQRQQLVAEADAEDRHAASRSRRGCTGTA